MMETDKKNRFSINTAVLVDDMISYVSKNLAVSVSVNYFKLFSRFILSVRFGCLPNLINNRALGKLYTTYGS